MKRILFIFQAFMLEKLSLRCEKITNFLLHWLLRSLIKCYVLKHGFET